jgi:hypothetical protein
VSLPPSHLAQDSEDAQFIGKVLLDFRQGKRIALASIRMGSHISAAVEKIRWLFPGHGRSFLTWLMAQLNICAFQLQSEALP